MSFPMLASKDFNSYRQMSIEPVQPITHVEPIVVPVSPSVTTLTETSQVSSIVSNIATVPKSLLWAVGISGAIGVISYISMKYCPWWKNRMWKKRSTNDNPNVKSDESK